MGGMTWLGNRFLSVVLAIALVAAAALPIAAPADPPARASAELAEAESEVEEEECEEFELADLEGLIEEFCVEEEPEEAEDGAPVECLLRTARARVVAYPTTDRMKLTVGYTTHEPTKATIELRRGPQKLVSTQRHLGRSGVIRLTKKLSDGQMRKVEAADHVNVRVNVAGVPGSCKRLGSLSPRPVLSPR